MTPFGRRLRELRAERGVTLSQMAEAIGVSPTQIEKYERADNTIAPARLHAIARALNVEPGWFFKDFPPDEGVPFDSDVEFAPYIKRDIIELSEQVATLPPEQRRVVRAMIQQFRAVAAPASAADDA